MTREEAIRKLQKQKVEYLEEWIDYSGVAEAFDMAVSALQQPEQPIRCKDCKYFAGEGMYCANDIIVMFDHFYCYHAERKEGEADG